MKKLFSLLFTTFALLTMHTQEARLQSTLEIYDLESHSRTIILQEEAHFEAPNWSRDGSYLLINRQGRLYKVDLESRQISLIDTDFADRLNNDHGISPDGKQLVISHHDSTVQPGSQNSRIYVLPIEGGTPTAVTALTPSYWHGWSPDGQTLAYVGMRDGEYDIYSISVEGGEETKLTEAPGLDDGPDYSPDGKYIYYNSMASGKMELWRMQADGSEKEQLTDDAFSNWFPHPSPDGKYLVYIAYLEDQGSAHPPMKAVALKLYDLADRSSKILCAFTGGQGTINVPSWSPDGKRFAFVSYRALP